MGGWCVEGIRAAEVNKTRKGDGGREDGQLSTERSGKASGIGVNRGDVWRKTIPENGKGKCVGPEVGEGLKSRNSKEASASSAK